MDVQTTTGVVRGAVKDGMTQFLGIPYAKPPVGELRWKRAQPIEPWSGVLVADRIVPRAMQMQMGEFIGSEDCLYLNIRCPADIEATVAGGKKLPVLFWIHGGGYNTGGMTDDISNGAPFVRDGIIFVEIQYRLNLVGFTDFGIIPGCGFVESNRGLSDMVQALTWVHENIAAFGGDPQKLTIMGESAGAASCTTLMAVPAVKGMFQQVISESSLPHCVQSHEQAKTLLYALMEHSGWKESDMPSLIKGDMEPLIRAAEYIQQKSQEIDPGTLLPCPCIDDLLPEYPMDAIKNGSAKGVRLILGTNLHEGTMFISDWMAVFPNSWEAIEAMFKKNGHEDKFAAVKAYYDHEDARYPGLISPFVNFATDYAFHVPGVELAEAHSHWGDTWLYTYELVTESSKAAKMLASHAFELAFVFETYDAEMPKMTLGDASQELKETLAREMHGSWVRFIAEGNPGADWPKMTGYETPVRIFDAKTVTRTDNLKPLMDLWDGIRFFR